MILFTFGSDPLLGINITKVRSCADFRCVEVLANEIIQSIFTIFTQET